MHKEQLISYTFPKYSGMIIAATLASTISSFVDGCITGGMLGSECMAAFGIAMPFVLILVVVAGMILSSGGSICGSKLIGSGEKEKANSNFTACLIMAVIVGIIALVVCFVFPDQLIAAAGAEGDLAKEASAYLRGYGFGTIPTILLTVLMYYANLDGNENLSFLAVAVMTVVDILLDLLLGVKLSMGLFGMALATSISYFCAIVVFMIAFLKGKSSFSISFARLGAEAKDILKTGYPAALNTLLVSCRCFFLNSLLMKLAGSDAVSAFSFQSNFNQFFIAIATGVSTAVSVLVGMYIGEKDEKGIRSSVRSGFRYGLLFSAVFMGILLIAAPVITKLLLSGSAVGFAYAVSALRLYSLSMPGSILCITLISFYQTMGDRKAANIIAVGHGLILPLGCAYLFSFIFGLNGVWISTFFAELFMLAAMFFLIRFKTGKAPKLLEGLACFDTKTFPADEQVFSVSANTRELNVDESCEALGTFLRGGSDRSGKTESILRAYKEILTLCKEKGKYVDVHSVADDAKQTVNISCDGRAPDKILNSEQWKQKFPAGDEPEIDSHYSAGISFIAIRHA